MNAAPKRLNLFERYLTLWVGACMLFGVLLGRTAPDAVDSLRRLEFGAGSQINIPIAVLIWLMIIPMMMKVDFASVRGVGQRPRGLLVTLFVNWLVKPFSMALIAWLFFRHVFAAWITPADADQYIAGCIILAAAPCTAMVFVWSYLTDGDPAYTLVQVSVNDLIMLFLFAPIVRFLVNGASTLTVPFAVLLWAVGIFIVIPLLAGTMIRGTLIRTHGDQWFEKQLLPRFAPVSMLALLATLVFIFAFQADNILGKPLHVLLIAIPILLQVYLNSSLAYGLMKALGVRHSVAAPGALIGASNFFELAVATAIALFGAGSGAALATVVGVLIEVPVMLSVCSVCNRTRHWFPAEEAASGSAKLMPTHDTRMVTTKRILVLCTGNSARSQMGEGLFRFLGGEGWDVHSAGTKPSFVRPEAIAAMKELGIDISGHRSKSVEEFEGQAFDYVVTVCDNARDNCPVFPSQAERIHWSFEDPAAVEGDDESRLDAFRKIRDQIHANVERFFASLRSGSK